MSSNYKHSVPDDIAESYIKNKGLVCPFCDSDDLETSSDDFETSPGFYEKAHMVVCQTCDRDWLETTKVTGIILNEPYEESTERVAFEYIEDAYKMLLLVCQVLNQPSSGIRSLLFSQNMQGVINGCVFAMTLMRPNLEIDPNVYEADVRRLIQDTLWKEAAGQ